MDSLHKSLEKYTLAQKRVSNHLVVLGIVLLLIALIAYFFGTGPVSDGLKVGADITGFLMLLSGFIYRNYCDRTHNKIMTQYEVSPSEGLKSEQQRMNKVAKGYLVYQIIFGSFILLAFLSTWFTGSFWNGVAYSIIILFAGMMIIEVFSNKSIKAYCNQLQINND